MEGRRGLARHEDGRATQTGSLHEHLIWHGFFDCIADCAEIRTGNPADKIVELAAELSADVIVLAVKTAEQLASKPLHLALETAYKVVTESICPVLTVRGRPT